MGAYFLPIKAKEEGKMPEDVTKLRDIETKTSQPTPPPTPAVEEEETEPEEEKVVKTWLENFSVRECEDIETVDRLTIKAGINEYKGQHLVFLAKVTDKDFSRQFFSMPAYVWEKAIPVLQRMTPKIAEVEKATMANAVKAELERLKALGVDINAILASVQGSKK